MKTGKGRRGQIVSREREYNAVLANQSGRGANAPSEGGMRR